MSKSHDRDHFESYREQTQVKHDILDAYLPAFFHILKSGNRNLLYIDGFAGRGTYTKSSGDPADGSPLRALKLISENPEFSNKVSTIFIESDPILYKELETVVNEFYSNHKGIRKPSCFHGTFAEQLDEILKAANGQLCPTFLFVDPCGVDGASMRTIQKVMNCRQCEVFIFFNLDGIRRVAGLNEVSPILIDLMGSRERAASLHTALNQSFDVSEREQLVLKEYRDALNDMGARFAAAFRIEHEDRRTTSHYLIHASKDPLAFAIMKSVMWSLGKGENQEGGLQFTQASRTNSLPLFDLGGDAIKEDILRALSKEPLKVKVFCVDWVQRPEDNLCDRAYKKALLELETSGQIVVLDKKDPTIIIPSVQRNKYKGRPTLGDDYFVKLR